MNIKAAKKKDEKAIIEILERTRPSIYAAIKKYAIWPYDIEEYYQEGVLIVLEAIDTFDEEKGVPFLAYVHTKLQYLYWNLRKERKFISLDEEIEEGINLIDLLVSDTDIETDFILNENIEILREALNALTERERICVEGYYLHRLSISELAQIQNIAYRTAYNAKTRGLNKLKKHFL